MLGGPSFVGKSYSIVAHQIARELVAKCPEIAEATCVLVSRIGWPVETPQTVELQIQSRKGVAVDTLREPTEAIARECLHGVTGLTLVLLDKASVESAAAWPGVLLF
jgi:S-adenosylmethionine synthetase